MVMNRRGSGSLGCLSSILILCVVLYIAVLFGEPWMRFRQYQDQMKTSARFAVSIPDSVIRVRLVALVDSLGLPRQAKRLRIDRNPVRQRIRISASYEETVKIPIIGDRVWKFNPKAEERL